MRCAGNMHSSYYKWNMAIICNPPIMLCTTFVPCYYVHSDALPLYQYEWQRTSVRYLSSYKVLLQYIGNYLAPGGVCEVLFSPGLSPCVSVCPANILVFYFSAIRRDIDRSEIYTGYLQGCTRFTS